VEEKEAEVEEEKEVEVEEEKEVEVEEEKAVEVEEEKEVEAEEERVEEVVEKEAGGLPQLATPVVVDGRTIRPPNKTYSGNNLPHVAGVDANTISHCGGRGHLG
jgi:hypothetical protein